MKLRKIFKLTISTVCLGLMISCSSIYGIDSMIKERYKKREVIVEKEIKDGKSQEYAKYYAILKICHGLEDDRARFFADMFIQEIGNGLNYSDAYVKSKMLGSSEEEARTQAKGIGSVDFLKKKEELNSRDYILDDWFDMMNKISIIRLRDMKAKKLIDRKVKSGKSQETDSEFEDMNQEYIQYYTRSKIERKLKGNELRYLSEVYIQERKKGRSPNYADYYAVLKVRRKLEESIARKQAEIYVQEREKGRNPDYADYYAEYYTMLVVKKNLEEDIARKQAEVYVKERKKGKRPVYADYYSTLIICTKLEESLARYRSSIYEEEMKKGKGFNYSDYYSMLIAESKLNEEEAKTRAEIYKQKMIEGKGKCYSHCYSILKVEMGLSEEESDIKAKLYEKEIDEIDKLIIDKEYYTKYRLRGMKSLEVLCITKIYKQELDQGKSREYAKYYANVIKFLKLDKKEAIRKAKAFEKEMLEENRSSTYADYYIHSIISGNSEELAKIQAEMYERDIISGRGRKELDKAEKEESYKIYKKNMQEKIYEESMNTRDRKDTREIIYASYYSKVKTDQIWRKK